MQTRSKNTRVDDAYDRLKFEITHSKLPPGSQAPEPDIAERLGMSRTPVREALIRLEADGLVNLVPRRGVRVLGVTVQDLVEVYDILSALEPIAISNLAGRTIASKDLEKLEDLIRDMDLALSQNDLDGWAQAEDGFYRLLLALSENRRLEKIVLGLHDQIRRGGMVLLRLRGVPVATVQNYRDLLAAIVSGDGSGAYKQSHSCRQKTLEIFCELFRTSQLSQI
ncbi:GntR family transcriptional regulator [Labrenzia aggregata]|uniref:GntR family transcriptional regulator n=2 Tax=Roseibium aggregatum TaxID=187304 RepID=A0A926P0X9_9HYPH|nr:GntR family transcriptional regulator [Roseibium aggregatum]